jgi:hypothetical protein
MLSCAAIEIERFTLAVWAVGLVESVTVTVTVRVPAALGVPTICPVFALIERPAGRLLADHVYGEFPPFAFIGALYGVFTIPDGSDDVVMVRAPLTVTFAVASAMFGEVARICVVPGAMPVTAIRRVVGELPSQMKLVFPVTLATPAGVVVSVTGTGTIAGPDSTSEICTVLVPVIEIEVGENTKLAATCTG